MNFTQLNNLIFPSKIRPAVCVYIYEVKDFAAVMLFAKCLCCACLQLIFEDLIERAKEKEEKEAKKRQRFAKDFTDKLSTIKAC